jgi:5-methylcytosine-specific restriction endonuclease McrA
MGAMIGIALAGPAGGTPGAVVGLILAALVALEPVIPQAPKRRTSSRTIPQDVKIAVSVRDGGKCRICGSTKDLQYDHIIPYSKGGRSDDPNNIQLLCGYHNRLKRDR